MEVLICIFLIVASLRAISVESIYYRSTSGAQCTLTSCSSEQARGYSRVQVENLPQPDTGRGESRQRRLGEEDATNGSERRPHRVTSSDSQTEHRETGSSFHNSQTNTYHSQRRTTHRSLFSTIPSPQTFITTQRTTSESRLANGLRSQTITESPKPSKILYPPDCGVVDDFDIRILGGNEVKKLGKWPWMVAYGYTMSGSRRSPMSFLCGGVLVTPKSSITAAHCADKAPMELKYVRLGDLDLDNFEEVKHVTKDVDYIVQHNKFNKTFIHDIAIVVTKEPVDFTKTIAPICLPVEMNNEMFERKRPFIAGWGRLGFKNEKNSKLHDAAVPVVPYEECRKIYEKQNMTVRRAHICAGGEEKDACIGDSGGPLMVPVDQHFYTIGVVSFGKECGVKDYPGVYTRVTTYMNWLRRNLI